VLNSASVRMVGDVGGWLSSRASRTPDDDVAGCLETLLEARIRWLDRPDPTLWKTGDVHRLLVDTAAVRLTDAYRLTELGPTVLRSLIDFLDDTDRFHPASMRITALRKELDRATAKFPAAMADPSVWGLAKRVMTALTAEGVDPTDDAAVDAWAADLSRASGGRRRQVLGVLLDRKPEFLTCQFVVRDGLVAAIAPGQPIPAQFSRHDPDTCPDCSRPPVNPPVALPPTDDLAAAARQSPLLSALAAGGRWAADGRVVTKRGFPTTADTRALGNALGVSVDSSVRDPRDHLRLTRMWRLACEVDVLRLHRTAVVAGPGLADVESALAAGTDPDRVLEVWKGIADSAVTSPAPVAGEDIPAGQREVTEFSRPWGPRALGELYRASGPVLLDDLIDGLVVDHHGPDTDEMLTVVVGAAVRSGLLAAREAGAVVVSTAPDLGAEADRLLARADLISGEPGWAIVPVPGVAVELTPLGRYLVRLNLLAEGTHAPLLEPATRSDR
jgi:hypothetical protein